MTMTQFEKDLILDGLHEVAIVAEDLGTSAATEEEANRWFDRAEMARKLINRIVLKEGE